MSSFFKRIIFTGCFLLMLATVVAQQKFSASISPAQVNKDQYVTLRLVVENADDIQSIDPPSLRDFKMVSGPNQESGMSNVNGVTSQYIALSYILQPKRPGRFSLDGATAVIGGKKVKSNPLSVVVKNETSPGGGNASGNNNNNTGGLNPFDLFQEDPTDKVDLKDYILGKNENVAEKVSKNMQLRLQTDKTSCYVGEPVVATYKLYTRLKSESKISKNPSFNGFSVIDMQPGNMTGYAKEKLNGREYNVYTLRKAQLYPLQAGDIELETAELENTIEFLKDDGSGGSAAALDFYSGLRVNPESMVSQTVSLQSKPVMITVKPLPEAGKPASFKGAVGSFGIEAVLQKKEFTTDETGMLAVRITGSGNLQLITAPDINWPEGVDGFDPKLVDNISNNTVPVSGSKTFTFSFAVQKDGSYTIPRISFSYFDPQTGTYKKDSTKPLSFTVTKGTGKPAYDLSDEPKKEKLSFLNEIFHHRWWIIVFVAVVILISLYYWLRHENKKEKEAAAAELEAKEAAERLQAEVLQHAALSQKNPLEETQACLYLEDCVEFYAVFNKEMKAFLAGKLNIDPVQINSKMIASAMDKIGIENSVVLDLQKLMQEIEWQLYTPFVQNEKRNELYERAQEVVQEVNSV